MSDTYSKIYTLTTNSYDCYDRIKPSTFLDLMQEVAGEHADLLGVGYKPFVEQNLYWVVVRNYLEILSHKKNIKRVEVITTIAKPRLFELPRDYIIKDLDTGEVVCKARSIWVIYNFETKQVISPKPFECLLSEDAGVFPRIRKLPKIDEKEYDYVKDFMVSFTMLDHNGHMNNSKCLDVFLDTIRPKENEVIDKIQVEYELQAFLDNLLSIYKKVEGNQYSVFAKVESLFWRIDAEINKL